MEKIRHHPWFESAYRIGVAIKGVDGMVELLAGVTLIFAPHTVHQLLSMIVGEAHNHRGYIWHFIATNIARTDGDLGRSGLSFLIVFLIGHGIVKIVLVYCLLKRILWAYPYALCILGLFLAYQLYVLVRNPLSIGMWLFTILDIVIIWLVWGEWQDLKEQVSASS